MSKYAIGSISEANTDLANSAEIGLENRVFYSLGDTKYVGKLEQDAAGDGVTDAGATLTGDASYDAPTSLASGWDMVAVLRQALVSPDGAFEAQLNVHLNGQAIASSTLASPGVITSVGHGLETGDVIDITGVTGSGATVLNGVNRVVTKISADTFSVAINTTGVGSGGSFSVVSTATITLVPPGHVSDQGYSLPQGLALDINPDVSRHSARTVRTIDSIESVTNGGPGTRIEFYVLPSSASYIELGCVEDKNITLPSPQPIRIPCQDQAARWTKLGRETDPQVTLSAKHRNFAEGLLRLNGLRHTLKIESRKDKRILAERIVFLDVIGQYSVEKGDGNALSMDKCTAIFSSVAVFV